MAWLAIAGQILSMIIKLFDLWLDKNKESAEAKKGAINDAVKVLSETDIDDDARRARLASALNRLKRLR